MAKSETCIYLSAHFTILNCKLVSFLIILISLVVANNQQLTNFPSSPCPSVFLYKYDGHEWYGEIRTQSPSVPSQTSSVQFNASFILRVNSNARTRNQAAIHPMTANIYRVTFSQFYPLPRIMRIIFNDKVVCEGGLNLGNLSPNEWVQSLSFPDKKIKSNSKNVSTTNSHCGTIHQIGPEVKPLVFGGVAIRRGQWPWLVAIYLVETFGIHFACGGSLLTQRAVVSAAHCLKTLNKLYQPREVLLYVGHHNRLDWNENDSQRIRPSEIIIHPEYKTEQQKRDADLAIVLSEELIEFNAYVQPICLCPEDENDDDLELDNQKGTVVGWGLDENGIVSSVPKRIELPLLKYKDCIKRSKALAPALSHRNFCAGARDGTGPCFGDSGSGIMILKNQRWTLRGIVSSGLSDIDNGLCKLNDFIIFTDVAKFVVWIKKIIAMTPINS